MYDEMLDADGHVRPAYSGFSSWYEEQDPAWLRRQDAEAERFFRRTGITFNVYGSDAVARNGRFPSTRFRGSLRPPNGAR